VDPEVSPVVGVEHTDRVMVLRSRVTAPVLARTLPSTVAPFCNVMLVRAKIVPRNSEFVYSVAELPTCQKMLHDCAPLIRATRLPTAVVSVDAGALNTKAAFGLPAASSVSVPSSASEGAPVYTPETSVIPPKFAEIVWSNDCPAAEL
jgi:hypothetical protein